MLNAFLQAKQWGKTPAEVFGITDEYTAYCFNEAIAIFGHWIEEELEKVPGKTDKERKGNRSLMLKSLMKETEGAGLADPADYFPR